MALNYAAKVDHEVDYAAAETRFGVERRYYSLGEDYSNVVAPTAIPGFGARWHGVVPGRLTVRSDAGSIEFLEDDGSFDIFGSSDGRNPSEWGWVPGNPSFPHTATRRRLSMVSVPATTRSDYFFSQPSVSNGPGEVRLDMPDASYVLFRRAGPSAPVDGVRYLVAVERGYADGYRVFYHYADTGEYPDIVSDSLGHQMALTWADAPRDAYLGIAAIHQVKVLSDIVLPDTTKLHYDYGYDLDVRGSKIKDRLKGVRHLTASGAVLWGRTYLYENGAVPYALTGKVDQNGNRLSTYTYDAAGLVTSTELAGGVGKFQIVNLEDTSYGARFTRQVTNPLGLRQDYVFFKEHNNVDAQRVLTSIVTYADAGIEANTTNFNYNGYIGDLSISDYTDEKGNVLHYDVDGLLRPTLTREASGTADARTTTQSWHPRFDLPTQTVVDGLTTSYTYGATGLPLTMTQTDTTAQTAPYATVGTARTWTYGWNGNGRLLSVNGPKGPDANGNDDLTSFAYDANGNLLGSTDALGDATTFALYDANGRPGQMTDPNGIVTTFAYDALGRVTDVTVKSPYGAAGDAVTSLEYDVEGRVVGVTAPATEKMIVDYDLAGRVTRVRSADGEQIAYTYDAMSDVTAETVSRANGTTARAITRTFDKLGRMVTEALGTNPARTWAYDRLGNVTGITSARSNATRQAFDRLNRLVSAVAPDTGTTATSYDARDDTTSFTDAKSVATTFVRNGFGDLIQEISPDRGTSIYYYDAAGDMTALIDGRGQRIDLVRDALGRVVRKTPVGRPASEIVTYTYDTPGIPDSFGVGRLATVADATGTTSFQYDWRGNMLRKRQAIGATASVDLRYAYDLADRVAKIAYPSGRIVEYRRDTKGRVVEVVTRPDPSGTNVTLASGMTYEPFGGLVTADLGNALTLLQKRSGDGRLSKKRLFYSSDGIDISSLSYGYDEDDDIVSITDNVDPSRSVTYGYDAVGRLSRSVSAAGTTRQQDFVYDTNGNLQRVEARATLGAATPSATATYALTPGTNRLASVTDASGVRSIGYDARGNTVSETRPGPVAVSAGYDGYGRLTSYANSGSASFANSYNGLDDRVAVATTTGGTTDVRRFVYDSDGRLLGEYGASATDVRAETIWLSPEVDGSGQPFGGDDAVGGYAPLAVVVGGTISWVHGNHLGVPIAITDANGDLAAPSGYTPVGFPGQTRTLSDLYYNRYRDYDPTTGRYIQADPIGLEGGSNPYAYAQGSPIRLTDPLGLSAAGRAIGGTIGGWAGGAIGELIDPLGGGVPGAMIGRAIGAAIGEACTQVRTDDPQCSKASDWDLKQAGIDPHDVKKEMGFVPTSRYDICKCRDGTFRVASVGTCGTTPQLLAIVY